MISAQAIRANILTAAPFALRVGRRVWVLARALIVLWLLGYAAVVTLASLYLSGSINTFDPGKTPHRYGAIYESVRLPSREAGIDLAGWYLPAPGARRAVLLVHGKDASRTSELQGAFVELASALQRQGFAVLMIDLRGHGQSTPSVTRFGQGEKFDVMGGVDWLRGRGFDAGRIGVLGVSMGASSAIMAMAEDKDIGALVSDCGFADFLPMAEGIGRKLTGLPGWLIAPPFAIAQRVTGVDFAASRPIDAMRKLLNRPVMVIHGAEDPLVPVAQGRMLAAANPNAIYWEVPGASHGASFRMAGPSVYAGRVIQFFDTNLK